MVAGDEVEEAKEEEEVEMEEIKENDAFRDAV